MYRPHGYAEQTGGVLLHAHEEEGVVGQDGQRLLGAHHGEPDEGPVAQEEVHTHGAGVLP